MALSKVCATESKNQGTENGGVFTYQIASKGELLINLIDLSTIFNCGVSDTGNNVIGLNNGNITISNTNESRNLAPYDPFYEIDNATTCQIKYCEFENSTGEKHTIAYGSTSATFNSCNIVNCKLTNPQGIFFFSGSTILFLNCAILQHESRYYFNLNQKSSVTLINCSIDCDSSAYDTAGSGPNIHDTSNVGKSSFVNYPSLFDYQICLNKDFYKFQHIDCNSVKFINYTFMNVPTMAAFVTINS